jgi:Asp-tRNA(Asn)/Glu-tRNA(Gln) amidotransferase C subunit
LRPDESEPGLEAIPPEVQQALEALLALAETLDELDLDNVEPLFTSFEWP